MRHKLHSLLYSGIQPLSIYSLHWHPINIQKGHKSSNSNYKIQNQPLSIVISPLAPNQYPKRSQIIKQQLQNTESTTFHRHLSIGTQSISKKVTNHQTAITKYRINHFPSS